MNSDTLVDLIEDAYGRMVPRSRVPEIDLLRDAQVREWIDRAHNVSRQLGAFKAQMLRDIGAFVQLSADQYDVHVGGRKGNLTLTTFDGRYKVVRQIQDRMMFDERLQAAKALIDECLREWTRGSNDNVRTLIEHAFQVDKEGRISVERVLGLRRLKIDDPTWVRAMQAIGDSLTVVSSKAYVRFYERIGEGDQWRPISLDIASVTEVEP